MQGQPCPKLCGRKTRKRQHENHISSLMKTSKLCSRCIIQFKFYSWSFVAISSLSCWLDSSCLRIYLLDISCHLKSVFVYQTDEIILKLRSGPTWRHDGRGWGGDSHCGWVAHTGWPGGVLNISCIEVNYFISTKFLYLDDWEEVCVFHCLHGSEPLLVVVSEKFVQKVQGLGAD